MRGVLAFLRATIVGGVLFLTPLVVLWVVLNKAVDLAARAIKPLAQRIPDSLGLGSAKTQIIAVLLLVLICFLSGLLARSRIARKSVQAIESKFLAFIPGYEYFKTEGASVLGATESSAQSVVLVRMGDSWRIGVMTEAIDDNWLAVFIPNAPDPHRGFVSIVERSNVLFTTLSLAGALSALRRCGAGTAWVADTLSTSRR